MIRDLDPGTGAVTGVETGLAWRLTAHTLVVRHPDGAAGPPWDVLGLRRPMCEVFTFTPEGPGRFRYTAVIEAGRVPRQPPVSGTMTRSGPTP